MPPAFRFGHFQLLPDQRVLLAGSTPLKLGSRAFDTLLALVERHDRCVSKHELLDLVWPRVVVEENNLEVQVAALRKLLGHVAIATIPGRGYRFTLPLLDDSPCVSSPAPAPLPRADNLPRHAQPLLGREQELGALAGLLDAHGLVTVAGAGGIGKTRLAQGAAAARLARQGGAVWWVELAGLNDPDLVPAAVGRALGLSLEGVTDPRQAVLQALQGRAALLVLDNAEHLLEGVAAFVTQLREQVEGVRLLVTSQEVLRALDEQVFRPGPLKLPRGDELADARGSGAVALFVARARLADPRFELHEDNRAEVVDICRRLDGIPLAIELAAARVPLLGVAGLRARLDERFHVLTAGARAVMKRHQTLRAALDWSHGLLTPVEQIVFRRLGVFAGGFTLDAAQGLVEDEDIDGWDVLEHLGALVDKSLVVADGNPLPRYHLLESTRLYALERLADAAETEALLRGHARSFAQFALDQDGEIAAHGRGATALARLDVERDNLLHALAWCDREGDPDAARIGQQLAGSLRYWWSSRALLPQGLRLMRAALARAAGLAPDAPRVKLLAAAAQAASWTGQPESESVLIDEMLRVTEAIGDAVGLATAHLLAGHHAMDADRLDDGERHLRKALQSARSLGHSRVESAALNGLVVLASARGLHDEAWVLAQEQLAARRSSGHTYNLMAFLLNAGIVAVARGDRVNLQALVLEAATLLPLTDSRFGELLLIRVLAPLLAMHGRWVPAVTLHAAAEARARETSQPSIDVLKLRQQRDLSQAREVIGQAAYDAAWAEGTALDARAASALAARELDVLKAPHAADDSTLPSVP